MRDDVHFAALRAAAKVAFGVAFFTGCSAATEPQTEEASSAESEINKSACKDDAGHADANTNKKSCDEVIATAFADAGPDDWAWNDTQNPKPASAELKSCCEEKLRGENGTSMPYRWSCCSVVGSWDHADHRVSMACTPWGPPVPPSMKPRRAGQPQPDAWIHAGVA